MNPTCTVCRQKPVSKPDHTMCPACYRRFCRIDEAASSQDGIRRDMVAEGLWVKETTNA